MADRYRAVVEFNRRITRIGNAFATLAGVGILVLMMLTVVDVVLRSGRGRGVEGATEMSEVALVGVVFLGMTAAQTTRSHISTPLMTSMMPPRLGHVTRALSLAGSAVFIAWVTYETGGTALSSFEAREFRYGIVSVPVWPARVLIPIGLLGLCLALVGHVAESFHKFIVNAPRDVVDYDSLP